jgi:hypothetical protein
LVTTDLTAAGGLGVKVIVEKRKMEDGGEQVEKVESKR